MKTYFLIALMAFLVPGDVDQNLTLINQGKADEAIVNLKKELGDNPSNARAHELLGLAYFKQNKLDAADQEVKASIELNPDLASARVSQARIAIAKQDWTVASRELAKATELDGSNPEILLYRGSMNLARKDYKAAVESLNPYVTSNPDDAYGHYYLGLAQYGLKRPDKTVEHFQKFLALAPNAPEAPRVESLLRSIR